MTKVSENFSKNELKCKHCGELKIDKNLISKLELVRTILNEPIIVNSGYRCNIHNKNVGGVVNSLHTKGQAVDVRAGNMEELKRISEKIFVNGGIGYYKNFIHLDTGRKRRFKG